MLRIPSKPYPVPFHSRDAVLRVARHEVGHMIAAKVVGFKTEHTNVDTTKRREPHGATFTRCLIRESRDEQ